MCSSVTVPLPLQFQNRYCFHQVEGNMKQLDIHCWQPADNTAAFFRNMVTVTKQQQQKKKLTLITQLAAADRRTGDQESCFNQYLGQASQKA